MLMTYVTGGGFTSVTGDDVTGYRQALATLASAYFRHHVFATSTDITVPKMQQVGQWVVDPRTRNTK